MAYAIGILILAALFAVFAARVIASYNPDPRNASAATPDRRTRLARTWRRLAAAAGRHYLTALILLSGIVFLFVLVIYAWRLLPITAGLLDRMGALDTAGNAEAARNIAFAIAAFAGMLAVLATVPFRLVRAWIAERTARVAESNLTTDLINKAVEGLGTEKTVSRIGRPVAGTDADQPDVTEIQWEGAALPDGAKPSGDWHTFDKTEPNLEVRIGAIYTLERIARENPEEHVRVMEILCAYIRENAPARDARPNPLAPFPGYPETPTAADRWSWTIDLRLNYAPRTDIQTALEVIGRRSVDQIAREGILDAAGEWTGYRLDLRGANLQAADLTDRHDRPMRLGYAVLISTRMEGAILREARMEGSDCSDAWMDGADLIDARMDGANLTVASMEGADLSGARMERSDLRGAWMQSANLKGARLKGAVLNRARMWRAALDDAQLDGADLIDAQMEGAFLHDARIEGAVLRWARMKGADLRGAIMEGAVLHGADLRSTKWASCQTGALAHSADLRGAKDLSQAQLDQMIGDRNTLLPDGPAPDTGAPYSIPSCWVFPPPFFEPMIARMVNLYFETRTVEELRNEFLCPKGAEPTRTGTPLPLDAPYPDGHPLADCED